MTRSPGPRPFAARLGVVIAIGLMVPATPFADELREELGRSESRIRSAPFRIEAGRTVAEYRLPQRLERLGYRRVSGRPDAPGEYFWGHERFWFFRYDHRLGGRDRPARLIGLELRRDRIVSAFDEALRPMPLERAWIEPEVLAESLGADRARTTAVDLGTLPDHVWRAVLAAEDHRFFDHMGVDGRSIARALLANAKQGQIAQGGSTITQQLIKNRDLTPKRTYGRKVSEALRALALESEFDKEEILAAYLDVVYLGHVDGLAVHGLATAAEVYFSTSAAHLDLAQSAALAALIQSPNGRSPLRHAEALTERRDWVLDRMADLDWASATAVRRAKRRPVSPRPRPPRRPGASHFLRWVAEIGADEAARRAEKGRGIVAETTLDPLLQVYAERAVTEGLERLRRDRPSIPATAALVAIEASTGNVLAYVGGDPQDGVSTFDRARRARRQPGSTIKPLALLEALDRCRAGGSPLTAASRILDEPVTLDLPGGPWSPQNDDRQFRGVVDVRRSLVRSLNVPFVRIVRHCGLQPTAERLRRAGLDLPDDPPPAMVLGAIETSPLELAAAFTVFATPGRAAEPRPLTRLERPKGRRLERFGTDDRRVVRPSTAHIVTDMLREAAEAGTARGAALEGFAVAAKTGTSSGRRDAWLAGHADGIVTVVWVGRDDDQPTGWTGGGAAAPIWREFMARAVPARPPRGSAKPAAVRELWVDPETGLLVRERNSRAELEVFRRGALPPRDRFWRRDAPVPVVN